MIDRAIRLLLVTSCAFPIFGLWHFVADWIFQSHDTAMRKTHSRSIRLHHSLIYGGCFYPLLRLIWPRYEAVPLLGFLLLVGSHYWEDSYRPVLWWFRNIRRPPGYQEQDTLIEYITTDPLGKILLIGVDQIIHMVCLFGTLLLMEWTTN